MTNEIRITGMTAEAARSALASVAGRESAGKTGAGEGVAKTVVSGDASDVAAVRQTRFARAQDTRDARFEDAQKSRPEAALLASAEDRLSELKGGVESVTKRYPPYPKDSPEREALLNQVIGLRKQVEALAVPKETDGTQQAGIADAEQKDRLRELMGLKDWPVDNISDEDLDNLLGRVDEALASVVRARESMWADVVGKVSSDDVKAAAEQSRASGEALADKASSISQDKRALASLA